MLELDNAYFIVSRILYSLWLFLWLLSKNSRSPPHCKSCTNAGKHTTVGHELLWMCAYNPAAYSNLVSTPLHTLGVHTYTGPQSIISKSLLLLFTKYRNSLDCLCVIFNHCKSIQNHMDISLLDSGLIADTRAGPSRFSLLGIVVVFPVFSLPAALDASSIDLIISVATQPNRWIKIGLLLLTHFYSGDCLTPATHR